jgi:aldehyde:ferredoxin oxidoreductase
MKFIRVNMQAKTVVTEEVPPAYRRLGGRRLTSTLINAEVPPMCDPLGPENKLFIAPGILSGTPLVNTSRVSIGAKSPLTGGIKESNAGGTVGAALGHLDITAVIIERQPAAEELFIIKIDEQGNAQLIPAQDHKGKLTYSLVEDLKDTFGENQSILCIGPAGEQQMLSASIQSTDIDDRPCRAAGRGGLGAVMGSKGIKAIVIDRRGKVEQPYAESTEFKASVKAFTKAINENPTAQLLRSQGTAALVALINSLGAFPCYNATKGVFDKWQAISGETMAALLKKRGGAAVHKGCSQCVIHCSNNFADDKGEYVTGSLEYETIWAMGGMSGVADLDTIARMDRMCDDFGLDTMNTGVAMAVAMDAGYKPFGDANALTEMMGEIQRGTDFGKILGNGPVAVGKHFSHQRIPTVKNQSIAGYDPRGMQGTGVTYSTSPMGADHTSGNVTDRYLKGLLVSHEPEGQMQASRQSQVTMAFLDTIGLCIMAGVALTSIEGITALFNVINAKLGTNYGMEQISITGVKVLTVEKEFNRKAGLGREDDRLPEFFYTEPLSPHNKVFAVSDMELDQVHDF